MKKNRGFSLVELLAVIVILGILSTITIVSYNRYIDSAKNKKEEENKNIIIMATKSFLQANKQYAPKSVGESVKIDVSVLKDDSYIKDELVNKKGEDCSDNSYVKVVKESGNKYSYQAVMLCGDEEDEAEDDNLPVIEASFIENTTLTTKSFKATITGSSDKKDEESSEDNKSNDNVLNVSNYSYKVYVKYIEDNNDSEYTEVFNSGVINVGGKKEVKTGPINVSEYIDVTKNNDIKVSISATNSGGYTATEVISENAQDNKGPTCGKIVGEVENDDDWLGKSDIFDENKKLVKPRTISVGCIDKEGSKCNKKRFTKSWPKKKDGKYVSAVKDTITISDNVGHPTECDVKVNVDVESPTLRVTAYKAQGNSISAGASPILTEKGPNKLKYREVKDGEKLTINSNEFTNTVGNDWLNGNNYKNGIAFKVETIDDIVIDKITLEYNETGLKESASASEIKKIIGEQEVKNPDQDKDMTHNIFIKSDGVRYLKINAYDKAGNVSTIVVNLKMDRTPPSGLTVTGYKKTNSDDAYKIYTKLPKYTFNTWLSGYVYTRASGATDSLSGFDVYRCTTKGQSSDITNSAQAGRNVNIEGLVTVSYKACDKAGNCTNDVSNNVKLDRTSPKKPSLTMTHSYDSSKSNGNRAQVYTNNSWINKTVYVTDARTVSNGSYKGPTTSDQVPYNGAEISKIARYEISTNGKNWETYKYDYKKEMYVISSEGTSKRYIRAVDNAGNKSGSLDLTIKIDKTRPSCSSYEVSGPSRYSVGVHVSCSDSRSGCQGTNVGNHYITSSSSWNVYDRAGNSCSTSASIYTTTECDLKTYYDKILLPAASASNTGTNFGNGDMCSNHTSCSSSYHAGVSCECYVSGCWCLCDCYRMVKKSYCEYYTLYHYGG